MLRLVTAALVATAVLVAGASEPARSGAFLPACQRQAERELEDAAGRLVVAMTNTKRLMNTVDYQLQSTIDASRRGRRGEALAFYTASLRNIDATFQKAAPALFAAVDGYAKFAATAGERCAAFIEAVSALDFESALERRIKEGRSPTVFRPAWQEAAALVAGKGEAGFVALIDEMRRRIGAVGSAYDAWVRQYRKVRPLIQRGTYYAVTERAFARTGRLHPVLVADERADAARYEFHVYYDAVLAIIREGVRAARR